MTIIRSSSGRRAFREQRRATRSRRVRALLSIGIVLGLGSVSTLAYWTDTATMTTGVISAASLDLQLQGNLPGQGGTWNNPAMSMANMIPGESFAVTVPVQRGPGTIPFTYTATALASGGLAPHLRWSVHAGAAGTAATNANGIRTNTCGGTALATALTLSATATPVIGTPRLLSGANMSENICIRVELPNAALNTAQSQTTTASFEFNATQLN